MNSKKILNLLYDKEADVLYLSKGKPSKFDISNEEKDEVVVRRSSETQEVTGLTIVNFSKKAANKTLPIELPAEISLESV